MDQTSPDVPRVKGKPALMKCGILWSFCGSEYARTEYSSEKQGHVIDSQASTVKRSRRIEYPDTGLADKDVKVIIIGAGAAV